MITRLAAVVSVFAVLSLDSRPAWGQPPRLTVSGNPALMRINTAVAGSQPTSVTNAVTTYNVRVGKTDNKKITARLNTNMPAGVTLTVTLAPPPGATSLGAITLTTTEQDAVVDITNVNVTQSITYQLTANVTAGVIPSSTRTVTLTLLDYP